MTTGHIVKVLRAFKNLSQPQLSYRAQLSQFTISAIETGRREPTKAHVPTGTLDRFEGDWT